MSSSPNPSLIFNIQQALRDFGLDAWLLGDFRGSNVLARRILGLAEGQMSSRRWFYSIPAHGTPQKLVHRIETGVLDHLPGEKLIYLRWQELQAGLNSLVGGAKRVAMEYSPQNAIPYISRTDAGTLELVRSLGAEPVSSGDLVQLFEATWDDEQQAMHYEAARCTNAAYDLAWRFIAEGIRAGAEVRETQVQKLIMDHFQACGMTTYHPPIVAANAHSGDPHFETCPEQDVVLKAGDFVLIDLWCKCNRPRAVYSDLTRVGYIGSDIPSRYAETFSLVAAARDAAIARVQQAFAQKETLHGWQVDDACRGVIEQAGLGSLFVHRTGHSIGQEVHGNGANMDNLETHDERCVLPRTCFSIEPGIYRPEFGVRSETNVLIDAAGGVHVTGGELQREVVAILR